MAHFFFLSDLGSTLQDHEVRNLLSFRREGEIRQQISDPVQNTVIYGNIANLLKEWWFDWTPKQVIKKGWEKTDFLINDMVSGSSMRRTKLPYYKLCKLIHSKKKEKKKKVFRSIQWNRIISHRTLYNLSMSWKSLHFVFVLVFNWKIGTVLKFVEDGKNT